MQTPAEELPQAVFEIDQPDTYGQFLLTSPREIAFYLQLLARQHTIVTAYIDDGRQFFLSSILALDEVARDRDREAAALRLGAEDVETRALDQVDLPGRFHPDLDRHGPASRRLPRRLGAHGGGDG